jgi:hypothetical protein
MGHHSDVPFNPFNPASEGIKALYHSSRAKEYFTKQTSVPRWYHTTSLDSMKLILQSGTIRVEHKQMYKGAWVSTQREPSINLQGGNAVLIFSHSIVELGEVAIGYENGIYGKRWRGLQCEIPVANPDPVKKPYLALLGLGSKWTKADKQIIKGHLQSKKIVDCTFLSLEGIDYIQVHLKKAIGNPNLTGKWWGKADVANLDRLVNH